MSAVLDLVVLALVAILRLAPRRGAVTLGAIFGSLASVAGARKNARVRLNLARAGVSDAPACRRAWTSFGRTIFEMMWVLSRSPERALRGVRIEGLAGLVAAAREARGVLLVSAHASNWELVAPAAARAGLEVAVVARGMRTPRFERKLIRWRLRGGVHTLVRGAGGTSLSAYRTLARGGVLGCMVDRASEPPWIVVPFLGASARVPAGPLELARRAGSAVVLGLARPGASGNQEVVFQRIPIGDWTERDEVAAAIMRAVEDELRERPEDWFWIYRGRADAAAGDP